MAEPLAYLNNRLIPQIEATLPLHDAGFVFGVTLTDQCRTFGHKLFRLSDHLARFRQSCHLAHVELPVAEERLGQIAEELVTHNAASLRPEEDLGLILFATPGPVAHLSGPDISDRKPTIGMHTFLLPFARYRRFFEEGARLVTPSIRHFSAFGLDPRIKHRSRLGWWLADREVQQSDPGAVPLLLDDKDQVTETPTANLLIVRGQTVLSPPMVTLLEGVSLLTVKELCAELAIAFEESPLTLTDCCAADEAWLTSTPFGIAGVQRINDVALPWPGPCFERLLGAFNRKVGLDIRGQIFAGP